MCASRRRTTPARASSTRASATFTGRSLVPTESTSTSSTSYRRARRRTSFRQLHRRNAPRDNNKREERLDEQEADHDDLDDGCARECGGGGDSRSGRRHRGAAAGGRLQHGLRPGLSQPEFEWAGQHDGRECRERQRRRRRKQARHAWPVLAVRVHVLLPTATRSIDRTARDEEGEARECGSFLSEGSIKGSIPTTVTSSRSKASSARCAASKTCIGASADVPCSNSRRSPRPAGAAEGRRM